MYNLSKSTKIDEGLRLKVYKDTNGFLTIGYGHNLANGITLEQAEMLFDSDIKSARSLLVNKCSWLLRVVPVEKFEALIELTFWIGISEVLKFKNMLAALRNQHWKIASKQLMDSDLGRNFPDRAQKLADVIGS